MKWHLSLDRKKQSKDSYRVLVYKGYKRAMHLHNYLTLSLWIISVCETCKHNITVGEKNDPLCFELWLPATACDLHLEKNMPRVLRPKLFHKA